MNNTVRVLIGGREYILKGDDENIVYRTAGVVNEHLDEVKRKNSDKTEPIITVLAALNIAEKNCKLQNELEANQNFLVSELNKMTQFMKKELLQ
ncbi:MAG: cell division protein ZapA [Bacteroidota bacterium]|jgi:cell division protein ZapA (FtsZ GTPase activity inhibitor)